MGAGTVPGLLPLDFGGPLEHPFEPFPRTALDATVAARFEAIAARHATRRAVADGIVSLSYGEVRESANRLAHAMLRAQGAGDGPIALLLGHNAYFPVAMMAGQGTQAIPQSRLFP